MRYHGAKFRLASWVMSFFPDHHTYVEPFGGAAGVLLQKPRSESEVYNDLDQEIGNVFCVLQDEESSSELQRLLLVTPYSRTEFNLSYEPTDDPVERARRTLIRAHMGFGSAGATKHKTGFRNDSARQYGTAAHLWAEYPVKIASFCQRMQGVLIETRVMGGHRYYQYEMSIEDHVELLMALLQLDGFVVLSGYDCNLYNDMLSGWDKHATTARISAGRGTDTRTECVWLNPMCADHQVQLRLFA